MSKTNLNKIEGYEYLTPKTKKKLVRELSHIQFKQGRLNGRAKRIKEIIKTKEVKK